jgi:hypothetical protein
MANIRLAVSYLPQYEPLLAAALQPLVAAFSPFGVHIHPERGAALERDPVDAPAWRNVINTLTQSSASSNPPAPAHVVLATVPPGFDQSINGQLLNRARGICAVYFGASSFQTPSPFKRLDLVVQVLVHEVGHLLNLVHGDTALSTHADALMPTSDRQRQLPADAWRAAVADAAARGEPPIAAPLPTLAYPFGAQCRACLRAAATNPQWWPWRSPFRGDFDVGTEVQDSSLRLSFANAPGGLATQVGDGINFTLEIRNDGTQPVPLPTHIGPEFGTLQVSIVPGDETAERHFVPDGYRCSSARQAVLPGESILRSFSIVPSPEQELFNAEGIHTLRVRLNSTDATGRRVHLGTGEASVNVQPTQGSRAATNVAAELIGALRGANAFPNEVSFQRLAQLSDTSPIAHHARYKLALMHDGGTRRRLLNDCVKPGVPPAIRHRAGRQLMLDALRAGKMRSGPSQAMRMLFNAPEDAELLETLERMRTGWNALSPLVSR